MDQPQRLARRQELEAARSYGGRATPASGSGWDIKADVETDTELIECKHTERKSFSLKLAELLKHATRSILVSKRMVFEVEFTQPDGSHPVRFVVLNKDEYITMRNELEILRVDASRLM